MTGFEAWVTFANDNIEAIEALVLAQSLKNVLTAKKIVAFVQNSKIDFELRTYLHRAFDLIINTDDFSNEIPNSDLANNLQMFRLNVCSKCVFLKPTVMVLQNCDELFTEATPGGWFKENAELNLPFIIFRPSNALWQTFLQLTFDYPQWIHEKHAFSFYLEKWRKDCCQQLSLPCEFFTTIGYNNYITRFSSNVKIVNLDFPNPLLTHNISGQHSDEIKISGSGVQSFLRVWMQTFRKQFPPGLLHNESSYFSTFALNNTGAHLSKPFGSEILSKEIRNSKTTSSQDCVNDIAIIGMSCKFPGADNIDEFWDLMIEGKEAITKVPDDRWNPKEEEFANIFGGFLKGPVDEFDGKFFGVSPREAQFIDPQQRMLLEQSWEALENAGINPLSLKGSPTGVFIGIWRNDYEKLILKESNFVEDFMRNYMGNSYAAAAGRISFCLGLTGCNVATDSGCSSSMMSVHLACESLKRGESELAIAGGVNLLIKPFSKKTMEHVLSVDGRCKTFDEKADGFGRAEGCGILVLKRVSDAIRDGDNVLAVIRGSGVSQEGTSSSFGTPSKNCQALSIRTALLNSGVDPLDVSYVEAHGTGTVKGDPIEMSAISEVYGENRKTPLVIGSVKTNIGHAESAAGVAGLIKTIMAMNKGVIPPHRNLNRLNPMIDLDSIPAIIPKSPLNWEQQGNKPRIAGVSSFGISGTNVHIVLQDNSELIQVQENSFEYERPKNILTISAKNEKALEELTEKYKSYLNSDPDLNFGDFCFTANTGRAHFSHRMAITSASSAELLQKLQKNDFVKNSDSGKGKTKIAFLFPGQGAQYSQMGKLLYDTHPVFRDSMDYSTSVFKKYLGVNLLDVIFNETEHELLHESVHSQTGIFCVEYSLLQLWSSFGIKPDLVLGHSLGEFAAAVAADILPFEELAKLVHTRTLLISNLPSGGMLAIKCSYEKIKPHLDIFLNNNNIEGNWIDIACINSPDQIVVSGKKDILEKFSIFCKGLGIKNTFLAAHHAYHSRDMDSILPEYFSLASTFKHKPAKCQYVSGMTGRLVKDSEINAHYWIDHCRNSVDFVTAIETAVNENCNIFIEIGPQPVLLNLGIQCIPRNIIPADNEILWLPSMKAKENNWSTLLDSLSLMYVHGQNVDWAGFDSPYKRKKVVLPTYPFQKQKYWFQSENLGAAGNFIGNNGKMLHPLVGKKVNLSSPDHVYQNIIDLATLPYLADHQVGKKVIMPCAGMLEMILAAGLLTLQKNDKMETPLFSLVVQDLKISSPFEIKKNDSCISEVVVQSKSDGSFTGFSVSLHRKVINSDGEGDWEQYAAGKFTPAAISKSDQSTNVDLVSIINRCEKSSSHTIYNKLFDIGLTFGNTFQSIISLWNGKNEVLAQVELKQETENQKISDYLCHPILIDAMIQLFVLSTNESNDLHLPISVDKFTWVSRSVSKTFYAYYKFSAKENFSSISLHDATGKLIAIMEGVSIVKTSVSSFLESINRENQLPGLYEEVWRNKCNGIYSPRVDFGEIPNLFLEEREFIEHVNLLNEKTEYHSQFEEAMDNICFLHISKAFINLGWCAKSGDFVNYDDLLQKFRIQSSFKQIFLRFLEVLVEENVLVPNHAKNSRFEWKVLEELPNIESINSSLANVNKFISSNTDEYRAELGLLNICGEKLDLVLQGKQLPLELIFPEDKTKFSADELYAKSTSMNRGYSQIVKYLEGLLKTIKNSSLQTDSKIRVLEIGAGTGGTSSKVLPFFESSGVPYHYTYTDISPLLIWSSQEKFKNYSKTVDFKLLNIENDPLDQGFAPNQFDIIIASNVLHATKNLEQTVQNCRKLLGTGGRFIIYETLTPERSIDVIFGLLPGYWRFEDFALRSSHATINGTSWCKLLEENGFNTPFIVETSKHSGVVVSQVTETVLIANKTEKSLAKLKHWVVVTEENNLFENTATLFNEYGRQFVEIRVSDVKKDFVNILNDLLNKNTIIEGVLYLGNSLLSNSSNCKESCADAILLITQHLIMCNINPSVKFVLVTQGIVTVEDQVPKYPSDGIYWGFARTLKNENPNISVLCIDLDPDETSPSSLANQLLSELFCTDYLDYQIAIRHGNRYALRLTKLEQGLKKLKLPNSDRFTICLPESKSFNDLKYIADFKRILRANEVEVAVRATSLNFRDVFVILKPEGFNIKAHSIGLDFSGIVSDIGSAVSKFKKGDPVFGLSFAGALSSHITVGHDYITEKPGLISFSEAAALPAVFCTAIYCLENVAQLTKDDTVLIHVASGGVGLCAIQIAKEIGARIVATAGSKRKRTYLRSLGIKHVFDSRSTTYGENIMTATGGVDVVLNSLTGPNFKETSLSVCKENARFIEIGKVGIWQPDQVFVLRPDVSYTIVDLEQVDPPVISSMISRISESLSTGLFKPLPITSFNGRQCRDAFIYFQKASHIGKIVVTIPRTKINLNKIVHYNPIFSEDSSYLITGGLGGIGLEVAKFMVDYGARHIVLVNRNPPNKEAQNVIDNLTKNGVQVHCFQFDIGNLSECQKLFSVFKDPKFGLPPLKGVMHAAGVISDAIIMNQTTEKFDLVFHPKVKGTWNLHLLTLEYNLEHFVMFSSMAAILSVMGQSNHASANTYLDALASYRHSLGLVATSINWGAWSQVGAAIKTAIGNEGMQGITPFSPSQGIAALKYLLRKNIVRAGCVNIDFEAYKAVYPNRRLYFQEVSSNSKNKSVETEKEIMNSEKFWRTFEMCSKDSQKLITFTKMQVESSIKQVLKLSDDEGIDENQNFGDMGLDSLLTVELKNKLQFLLGNQVLLSASTLEDFPTVKTLVAFIIEKSKSEKQSN